MLFNIFNFIANNLTFFTGSYSNNVFPDPLPKEEEEKKDDIYKSNGTAF